MMSDVPESSNPGPTNDHEHAWLCVEDGDSTGAWAFECTICHRTRAGMRVSRNGRDDSGSDVARAKRQASADARERALDDRESRLVAEASSQAERRDEVEHVMAKAVLRDEIAEARDLAASKRDMAANLHAWLHDVDDRPAAEARQDALDDRLHSAGDRKSSALDRSILADQDESVGSSGT